ncbi:MAG: hypothetical protein Q8832_02720, partial [Candidatus Phytoplasma australasiaticum]|nr:hypothetical protein [Candidatus Phytoplasma australasiaticum]
ICLSSQTRFFDPNPIKGVLILFCPSISDFFSAGILACWSSTTQDLLRLRFENKNHILTLLQTK